MNFKSYRSRIYGQYVMAREQALAPNTLEGLVPRAPMLRQLVRRYFPEDKDANVLDLGCGHGAVIYFAREAGYRNVRGVDGSPEQVAAAARLGIKEVVQGDLHDVLREQPAASVEVVIAFDVIEHFTRDELVPFVDEVYRVLSPGGRWIMHVPNGESPFCGRMRYWDMTHELAFTRTSLGQLLLSSGFSSVHCFEDTPIVHGVKSAARWVLWKCFRSMLRLYIAVETGDTSRSQVFSQNMLAVATR